MNWMHDPEFLKLKKEFVDTFMERSQMLRTLLAKADAESLLEIQRIAHSISGIAATYGFNEIGNKGEEVDLFLESQFKAGTMDLIKANILVEELFSQLEKASKE